MQESTPLDHEPTSKYAPPTGSLGALHRLRRQPILVAIPTCNRPDDLNRCLASLAHVEYDNWKVILFDQSDGDQATRQVADTWRPCLPELRHVRLNRKNASAAQNMAVEMAGDEVLAFLDDDCTVGPDWLQNVSEAFEREPQASLVFGALEAMEHDPTLVLVPSYTPSRTRCLRGRISALRIRGFGAAMYLRIPSVGGPRFDVRLGPGSRFRSSQDWDYAYRILAGGGLVVETPRIVVVHHGARPYASGEGRTQFRENRYGSGASHAKLLRCGEWMMLAVIAVKLARTISEIRPQNVLSHQPTHFGRLLMYVRGLRDGFRAPIDRQSRVFSVVGP